jgi:hypothetical protein
VIKNLGNTSLSDVAQLAPEYVNVKLRRAIRDRDKDFSIIHS